LVFHLEGIIELKDLRKVYRIGSEKVVALDRVDLVIKKGEFCCLLGTSGSGKSTMLNLMAGLEKPTKGSISIKGESIENMSEKKLARFRQEHLGFVFQSYNLLPTLTALENVCLPLTFKGISKSTREKKAWEMLKAVGLSKHARHKPSQMSGGQQQRVGIARAFIAMPEIVFADEPTGNLDSKTTKEVMGLITKMARDNNQTLVIVTHDTEISQYADRIIHILDGNIEKIELNIKTGGSIDEKVECSDLGNFTDMPAII
jgi:putative ABC transport system ATP-binding protein